VGAGARGAYLGHALDTDELPEGVHVDAAPQEPPRRRHPRVATLTAAELP